MVYNGHNFIREGIAGAVTPVQQSQKILNPRCSEGLGKARIPNRLAEAGADYLGMGLQALSFL